MIAQTDAGPGGRSSQLSAHTKANAAEMVLQLACWTAATGQGARTDIAGEPGIPVLSQVTCLTATKGSAH